MSVTLLAKYSDIIFLELLNSCICKWMVNHLLDYLIWYCCNISSCKCTVCNMYWISYTCTDNLCLKIIVCKYICNILNKINSRL